MAEYHYDLDTRKQRAKLHGLKKELLESFGDFNNKVFAEGALSVKTKELIALAISVAIRCDGCIAFHSQAAVKHGATRDEIMEVMGMALYMGAGPSLMYAAQAVEAFDQFAAQANAPD